MSLVALLLVTACEAEEAEPSSTDRFAIAVIADPHITGPGQRQERLQRALDWINSQVEERQIALVLVMGDIGWGAGLSTAALQLDTLDVPYVPVRGDNEVQLGSEEAFETVFADRIDRLAAVTSDFEKAPVPSVNPMDGQQIWLQNFGFTFRGLRFLVLDWCARGDVGELASELGHMHDFEGGTLPWLKTQLEAMDRGPRKSLILLSHIPMHDGLFDESEMDTIVSLFTPWSGQLYANFAGHMHLTYEDEVARGLYQVFVTAATFGSDIPVRVVTVEGDGTAFSYTQEVVTL